MASEDALTGLANRRKFNEHFEKLYKLYKKGINRLTLFLIDIDDFKEVNDTFGHLIGDEALIRVADILRVELRASDMIARWGGEEFALLLIDVSPEKAMEIAQKLCQAIKEDKVLTQLLQKPLTVSIGLGELSSLESQDGLVYKVDNALYEAKKAGKDQVVVA